MANNKGIAVVREQDHQISRLEKRLHSVRSHTEEKATATQDVAVAVVAAFIFANAKQRAQAQGQTLPTVAGLDPEITWSALLIFGAPHFSSGNTARVARAAGVGIACSYAAQRGMGR